jgi:chromosome partitioning protein
MDTPKPRILGFFNMVQSSKKLHANVMASLRQDFPHMFLGTQIPFAADIERMALDQAPLSATRSGARSSRAFDQLAKEVMQHLDLPWSR